eukprot:INCI13879.2.p1 GENE.INCI13879.2~~INCI13879.2.p1  ORF type:complete len:220 (+),score=34.46 INCI13879.2:282-941(+)
MLTLPALQVSMWTVLVIWLLTSVSAQNKAGEGPGAETENPRGPCTTCIFVLERIKQGLTGPREAVCEEVWFNSLTKDDYKNCFDTIDALDLWRDHIDSWINDGCYRKDSYGFLRGGLDVALIKPCPSHVICGVVANPNTLSGTSSKAIVQVESNARPFCPKAKEEYDEKFFSDDRRAQKQKAANADTSGLNGDPKLQQLAMPPLFQLLRHLKPPTQQQN